MAGNKAFNKLRRRTPGAGLAVVCLLLFLMANSAEAFVLTETQPMRFGRFMVINNMSPISVTMDVNGNISSNGGDFLVFKDTQPGAYYVTGAPAFATTTITVAPDPVDITIVNNRYFRVSSFTVSNGTTDASGNLAFTVGATIQTDGAGVYNEAFYSGNITVTVTIP